MIPEGWTAHDGGEMPVNGDAEVSVLFQDGGRDATYAGFWSAPFAGADDNWAWDCPPDDRIIAYQEVT